MESRLNGIIGGVAPSPSPSAFLIANGLFVFLTLHSALGVLRFGHPQLCMNGGFRKIYEVSFILLRILPSTLITAQIYGFYSRHRQLGVLVEQDSLLFNYDLSLAILGCVLVSILNELWRSFSFIKLSVLFADVFVLALLGALDESYWTIFLGVQILFCNVGLDWISRRFEIGFLEMFTLGLCFFNVFAYRSLVELIEIVQESF